MADYIKRVDALKAATLAELDVDFVIEAIRNIPAADVRPVARSHWEYHLAPLALKCATCHKKVAYKYAVESNYCPNCGAKMDADMREDTDAEV